MSDTLTVTLPLRPSLDEFKLARYLGVPYISLFTNGTLPLLTALQALDVEGEVITPPYSFIATTHAIWWNALQDKRDSGHCHPPQCLRAPLFLSAHQHHPALQKLPGTMRENLPRAHKLAEQVTRMTLKE